MKLSKILENSLNSMKGTGKIKNYENVAGGVIIEFNEGYSEIFRSAQDIVTVLTQIVASEE